MYQNDRIQGLNRFLIFRVKIAQARQNTHPKFCAIYDWDRKRAAKESLLPDLRARAIGQDHRLNSAMSSYANATFSLGSIEGRMVASFRGKSLLSTQCDN